MAAAARHDSGTPVGPLPVNVRSPLADGGRPLLSRLADAMGAALHADLGAVQVHDDAAADLRVRAQGALALAEGPHLYFRKGAYRPGSAEGDWLLAHELAHVGRAHAGLRAFKPGRRAGLLAEERVADADADRAVQALHGDDGTRALLSPFDQLLNDRIYELLASRYATPAQWWLAGDWPELQDALPAAWPADVGAFYHALCVAPSPRVQPQPGVPLRPGAFDLLDPIGLSATEFEALRALGAMEQFLRVMGLAPRFIDPAGGLVLPTELTDYQQRLFDSAADPSQPIFADAQSAIEHFRGSLLGLTRAASALLAPLPERLLPTLGQNISRFHAALFALYLQSAGAQAWGDPTGATAAQPALANAIARYTASANAEVLATQVAADFDAALTDAALGSDAVIAALACSNLGASPVGGGDPIASIEPAAVRLTNTLLPSLRFTWISSSLDPTLVANAEAIAAFEERVKAAVDADGVYAVLRQFDRSALDRQKLYRHYLDIEPQWLDIADARHDPLYSLFPPHYLARPESSPMSDAQWSLVTQLATARLRRAELDTYAAVLSFMVPVLAAVLSFGNPLASMAAAAAVTAAFGSADALRALESARIAAGASATQQLSGEPVGSVANAELARREAQAAQAAILPRSVAAALVAGLPVPGTGPVTRVAGAGLVGGGGGAVAAAVDPRVTDESLRREQLRLAGGDPDAPIDVLRELLWAAFLGMAQGALAQAGGEAIGALGRGLPQPAVPAEPAVLVRRAQLFEVLDTVETPSGVRLIDRRDLVVLGTLRPDGSRSINLQKLQQLMDEFDFPWPAATGLGPSSAPPAAPTPPVLPGRPAGPPMLSGPARPLLTDRGAAAPAPTGGRLTIVELGAGRSLGSAIRMAQRPGVRIVAVDPAAPEPAALANFTALGGEFIQGTADDLATGLADHVYFNFPYRFEGSGRNLGSGTATLIEDALRLMGSAGSAHFVTESLLTAQFFEMQAADAGAYAIVYGPHPAARAAPNSAGEGLPDFGPHTPAYFITLSRQPGLPASGAGPPPFVRPTRPGSGLPSDFGGSQLAPAPPSVRTPAGAAPPPSPPSPPRLQLPAPRGTLANARPARALGSTLDPILRNNIDSPERSYASKTIIDALCSDYPELRIVSREREDLGGLNNYNALVSFYLLDDDVRLVVFEAPESMQARTVAHEIMHIDDFASGRVGAYSRLAARREDDDAMLFRLAEVQGTPSTWFQVNRYLMEVVNYARDVVRFGDAPRIASMVENLNALEKQLRSTLGATSDPAMHEATMGGLRKEARDAWPDLPQLLYRARDRSRYLYDRDFQPTVNSSPLVQDLLGELLRPAPPSSLPAQFD